MTTSNPYTTDVSDDAWALVAFGLEPLPLDAKLHLRDLIEVFGAARFDRGGLLAPALAAQRLPALGMLFTTAKSSDDCWR